MKLRLPLTALFILVCTSASAASVLIGNGISWPRAVNGVGANSGTITLNANVNKPSFNFGELGYLSDVGIKNPGSPESSEFRITSVSSPDWTANNGDVNSACEKGDSDSAKRGCNPAADRNSSSDGDLAIVLGVKSGSGELEDHFHFNVLWENLVGDKIANHISDDLSAVPLPAAAWLFASALLGLSVVARRRDNKNQTAV